jgi:hypothetical protein
VIVAEDFLNQARNLLAAGQTIHETGCRSAVSRAYYSLYHEARNCLETRRRDLLVLGMQDYLLTKGVTSFDPQRALRDSRYLSQWFFNLHQVYGFALAHANQDKGDDYGMYRDDRNIADYELHQDLDVDDSRIKVEEIWGLIEFVRRL